MLWGACSLTNETKSREQIQDWPVLYRAKTVSKKKKMPTVCLVFVIIYFSPLFLRKMVLVKWIDKLLIHKKKRR